MQVVRRPSNRSRPPSPLLRCDKNHERLSSQDFNVKRSPSSPDKLGQSKSRVDVRESTYPVV